MSVSGEHTRLRDNYVVILLSSPHTVHYVLHRQRWEFIVKRGRKTRPLDPFNDWGGGCNKFVPVLGGNGKKIAPTGDIFDRTPGQMRLIRGKLADYVGDRAVLSPERGCFSDLPGDEIVVSLPSPIVEPLINEPTR